MLRSTAIWNRDSILELLSRELARTARENGQLCVMMAGIDQFQTISRDRGQSQSEAVVGEVAKRLTAGVRPYDHVGRYSAEQLLIVTPGYTLGEATTVAEKLREAVADAPVEVSGGGLRITATISLVGLDDFDFKDEDDLLRTLEQVLYRAAAGGGNRVVTVGRIANIQARIRPARRVSIPLVLATALLLGFVALFFVAPAWTCAPFRAAEIIDSSELPPPLPPDCFPSVDHPSDALLLSLDTHREAQGLMLQRTITCKVKLASGPAGRTARTRQQQWIDEVYSGGSLQMRRHVLLAATEDVPGGTLFTVELCLMPWWKYVNGAGDSCWGQLGFWK
jgi:diguanylate cyclase (GGDEF)-like protein